MCYRLIEMRDQGLYDGSGIAAQKFAAPRQRFPA